jgi:hypothetical protein
MIMFRRLKRWLVAWAEGYQQREIERLYEESCRLKAELMDLNGGEPIRLSPEERSLLAEKAKEIDSEVLKQITVFESEDRNPVCPNETSAESP